MTFYSNFFALKFKKLISIILFSESISALQRLQTFRIARNDLEVVNDLTYLRFLKELVHLRIDENPISLLERTVPYALFCVQSLDTINGTNFLFFVFLLSFGEAAIFCSFSLFLDFFSIGATPLSTC